MVDRKVSGTSRPPSQLPGHPGKSGGGIQITHLSGAARPGPAEKPPQEKPAPGAGASPALPASLAFGEVDLGATDEPLPEMAAQEGSPAPSAPKTPPARAAKPAMPAAEPEPPAPPKERPYIRVHSAAHKRDMSKFVRIAIILTVALVVLGGAFYGIMKFIESRRLAQQEEIKMLDRSSLDRIKSEAARNQGITP